MASQATHGPVPRYREVADVLQGRITAGRLIAGSRVPSEREIAREFGLSRMTARQAVELLVRRGAVYRRPGAGTYVAPERIEHTLQRLVGFSEQMLAQGIQPAARVLETVLGPVDDGTVAEALALAPGERAWFVRRVRLGDGEPLLVESFHVPERICPDLDRHDLERGSLYAILRETYGVVPAGAHATIEPTACEPDLAGQLGTLPGSPALLVTRLTRDADGHGVEFARDLYRGDRARFVIDLAS